ncbi:MAG: transporter, partial [Gammaproteobacteria bacterium]
MRRRALAAVACCIASGVAARAVAQESEPRAYSASPVGTNFAVLGYGNTSGDVVFDSSAPFTDVEAEVDTVSAAFGRVFALGGRQTSISVAAPYQWGEASGSVGESRRSVERSGMGDLRLRVATMLVGGEALAPREFAARKRGPSVGV